MVDLGLPIFDTSDASGSPAVSDPNVGDAGGIAGQQAAAGAPEVSTPQLRALKDAVKGAEELLKRFSGQQDSSEPSPTPSVVWFLLCLAVIIVIFIVFINYHYCYSQMCADLVGIPQASTLHLPQFFRSQ